MSLEPTAATASATGAPTDTIEIVEVPLGPRSGERARIGLIALASGTTGEDEMHAMLPPGTQVLTTRVANSDSIDLGSLADMESDMMRAASTLLPDGHLDVVAYSCTSGTIAMGEETVFARIREARPGVEVTTPFTAAMTAFDTLGVRRVAMLTPYTAEVTRAMREEFERRGLAVSGTVVFGLTLDSQMGRVSPETVRDVALGMDLSGVDALFISCTALRTSPVIQAIEDAIGKPVVSSNQALVWHSLRLAGYAEAVPGLGRLFLL